jgi:hypothetical protein
VNDVTDGGGPAAREAWDVVRDPSGRIALPCPRGWRATGVPAGPVSVEVPGVVAVLAPRPARDTALRASISAVEEQLPQALAAHPERHLAQHLDNTVLALDDALVVDVEPAVLAGRRGHRVLLGHRSGGHVLAVEQWVAVDGGRALTVTATCEVSEHLRLLPVVEAAVSALRWDA